MNNRYTNRVSRRSLLAGGLALAAAAFSQSGCGAVGGVLVRSYLKKFAEQLVMDEMENGIEWFAKKGVSLVVDSFISDAPSSFVGAKTTGDAWTAGSKSLFGVAAAGDLEKTPGAGLISSHGDQVVILPRAAQAMSKAFDEMRDGVDGIGKLSPGRTADYLYPSVVPADQGTARVGELALVGGEMFYYETREGSVCLCYVEPDDTSQEPYERICVYGARNQFWATNYTIAPNRLELA